MAKIVTCEEQKEALKVVVAELKNLNKLKKLLYAQGSECKLSFAFVGEENLCEKAGCWLSGEDALQLVASIYQKKAKAVKNLIEEHHIMLDEAEMALLKEVKS